MKVLIACETSGIARRAFAALGHDVWSCDILPAEDRSNRHIVCDVRDGILTEGWDLLCVMHPPCDRLCRSGRRWMSGKGKWTPPKQLPKGRTWDCMKAQFELGVDVFTTCWNAPIERVAIENPEMNDLARDRMPADLPKPHMVQPFWFGEPAYKATGWYLRGLPPLAETNRLPEPERGSDEWKRWNAVHRMPPGPDRARLRSRSFPGMMSAAAEQWGGYAMEDTSLTLLHDLARAKAIFQARTLETILTERPMTEPEKDDDKPKRCVVCDGRGYFNCDCWPGDCICGWGDETCEECEGTGFIFPDYHDWDH